MVGGNDVRLTTLGGSGDAEQPNNVRVVCVEELSGLRSVVMNTSMDDVSMHDLPSIGSIDSNFVDLGCILAKILDVSKHMATTILTDEVAKVCPKSHICNGGFVVAPFVDGEAFEEDETLAVEDLRSDGRQQYRQLWQREGVL